MKAEMKHRLIMVEGLPCSGKSSMSAFAAQILRRSCCVRYVDEGTGNHPADYEFHAYAPAGWIAEKRQIVALSGLPAQLQERLMAYKIYDGLAWEEERPLMLEKWRQFAQTADEDMTYVFNCVFLQNPMCETMMRFDFDEGVSRAYIEEIAALIYPMNPLVIYLKNDDIAHSVRQAAAQRPGWLDTVIDYHTGGAYGKRIGAKGFDGYIRCLEERQNRELRILSGLPIGHIVMDNPQRDWDAAKAELMSIL